MSFSALSGTTITQTLMAPFYARHSFWLRETKGELRLNPTELHRRQPEFAMSVRIFYWVPRPNVGGWQHSTSLPNESRASVHA